MPSNTEKVKSSARKSDVTPLFTYSTRKETEKKKEIYSGTCLVPVPRFPVVVGQFTSVTYLAWTTWSKTLWLRGKMRLKDKATVEPRSFDHLRTMEIWSCLPGGRVNEVGSHYGTTALNMYCTWIHLIALEIILSTVIFQP